MYTLGGFLELKRIIKQFFCLLLACFLFPISVYARPDWPSDTGIQAQAGIVIDADSGAVLFGQNIHVPSPPASITKLMTALIVLENCELDEQVTFSETAVLSVESDSGNKISSSAGDIMSVEDCLYAMLMVSSNQTANALAEHVAGSISGFVEMMNDKLIELGCEESHFDNPSGLNGDSQYVSAYDMALIAKAAFQNPDLLRISSTEAHRIGGNTIYPDGQGLKTEHRLLYTHDENSEYYYPWAKAGKTGYLIAAGNTLVTYAERDGRSQIAVILKGQPYQYFRDTIEILSFGFRNFQSLNVSQYEMRYITGDEMINLDVGSHPASDLEIDPDAVITLPRSATFEDAELTLSALPEHYPERAVAVLHYTYNDREIGDAFLMLKESAIPAPEPETEAPEETAPEQTLPASVPVSEPSGIQPSTILGIILLVLALLLAAALIWTLYRRKKEAEESAQRRALRRERLRQSGEEAEFERLLAEWNQRREQANGE